MRKRCEKLWALLGATVMLTALACQGCGKDENSGETTKETETVADINGNQVKDETIFDIKATGKIDRIVCTIYGEDSSTVGFSWYTENKADYGNDIEIYDMSSGEKITKGIIVTNGVAAYDEGSVWHQAVVEGLPEDTKFAYRVGDAGKNEWSEYGTFTTASDEVKEFSFVAITDTQSGHLPDAYFAADTLKKAFEEAPDARLILHSGDIVDDGSNEYYWQMMLNASQEMYMDAILVPVAGNHEGDANAFWQHFKLQATNGHKTTGLYYSFDYGNVHFVALDTNKSTDTCYIDDEQLYWLEKDLEKAKEKGQWIVVNMHRGIYTVGDHADGDKYVQMRIRVSKVLEKYGVDVVFQGHDHSTSVTKKLVQGEVNDEGVIYINIGSSGPKAYSCNEELTEDYLALFDLYQKEEKKKDTFQNFATVNVTDDSLTIYLYEANETNYKEIKLLKTIEITR